MAALFPILAAEELGPVLTGRLWGAAKKYVVNLENYSERYDVDFSAD